MFEAVTHPWATQQAAQNFIDEYLKPTLDLEPPFFSYPSIEEVGFHIALGIT